jgi:Domain of unknown function (DUF4397)
MQAWIRNLRFAPLFAFALAGCHDNTTPTTPSGGGSTTTTAIVSSKALIRAAQLTEDARTVDVLVNGRVVAEGIGYPGVSSYFEVDPGETRVQFLPAGTRRSSLAETTLTVSANQAMTIAVVGADLDVVVFANDLVSPPDRSWIRLVNAVDDYPSKLTLAVRNGQVAVSNVGYPQASPYVALVPGLYDFALRRAGTSEEVADVSGVPLAPVVAYTAFAVGTLRRDDVEIFVARDR